MALISKDTVERVKEAADIAEVISAYTDLRRAGAQMMGLCPFHEESSPSFSVDPVRKLYHCFGCQAGGDVFRFVQEQEGLDFGEAVEMLADRYGVEIQRERNDPKAEAARRRRARLYELLQRTAEFYERFLWESPKAGKAREYLLRRGLEEKALREYGVGMAPAAWDQVLVGSQRARFTIPELVGAGLIQKGRQGGHYDRFRKRITFPIRDQRGRVLGFGARALSPDSKPKYLNSPEGEIYRKSETLYGIDLARAAIARARRVIVVEGYTDVIALHQAGIAETVAVMGTAITPEQLGMLAQAGPERVVLALDADRAGADAMIRAQRVAGSKSLDLLVAAMPEGEDPADMLVAGQIERFKGLVEEAIDLPSFRVRTALGRADVGTPTGRERALGEVAPVLKAMGKVVGRDELVREVADRLDVDPGFVNERVMKASFEEVPAQPPARREGGAAPAEGEGRGESARLHQAAPLTPRENRERALLAMCVADPKAGKAYLGRLRDEHMSASGRPALAWLRDHLDDPLAGLPRDDPELLSVVTEIKMRADREPAPTEQGMDLNFMLLEQRRLEDGIAAARKAGDLDAVNRLSREGSELTSRIAHAESLGALGTLSGPGRR
ncbi:MAG: DNA primase [Solirubrobacterales bacterium]